LKREWGGVHVKERDKLEYPGVHGDNIKPTLLK